MTQPLRLAFMGSPDIAVSVLAALIEAGHEIACVYSQPPRKAGRGKNLRKTAVHEYAERHGLEVRTPGSLKGTDEQAEFAALGLEAAVVVAYGLILPQAILDATRLGCLNMHASLLPRWRGAAPIQRAIMAGDTETGVEAMLMEAGLDTGPVLATARTPIAPDDTAGSLHDRLADLAAELAPRALAGLADGSLLPQAQSKEDMSYAHKITSADQGIDWSRGAAEIHNQIRGLSPFPGAFCHWLEAGEERPVRLKILMSEQIASAHGDQPGAVLDDNLTIACGEGALRLTRLQKPGGKPLDARDFLVGTPLKSGDRLESVARIRLAKPCDMAGIQTVNDAAFGGTNESGIIAALGRDGDSLVSLVAEMEGRIVGHIEMFRLAIDGKSIAAGLGPMSVVPGLQKRGIGSMLVRAALTEVRRQKRALVFVLGHRTYYPRFAFSADIAESFDAPWSGESFMALRLRESAPTRGAITYPPAFHEGAD